VSLSSRDQRGIVQIAAHAAAGGELPARAGLKQSQVRRVERKIQVERRAHIESIEDDNGAVRIALGGGRVAVVDEVIGLTGYRPDLSFLSELALEISPATEGSARLSRALSNVTDCLSVPAVTPADLDSGEQGFYLAGAKSYGRARTFLLKSGYAQLGTILNSSVDRMT